jgi:hypothetical protein
VTKGRVFVGQDYADESVPLTITEADQIGCEFTNDDMTLSMDDFSGRFIKPAMVPMANSIDQFILADYFTVYNATGSPGTTAATPTPFLDAHTILFNNAAFMTPDLPMLVTGKVSARLSDNLAIRFNPAPELSELYRRGMMAGGTMKSMGHALGWNFYEDQNMPVHTTGAWAGATPIVTVAGQTGATILTSGFTASVVGLGKKGDPVQFAGTFGVNPVTKANTGELQNFVLTADVSSDGGGLASLPIDPPIITAGKDQNVVAAPAANAAITVWGTATLANIASKTSPQCMGWQNEAITLAMVDLMIPDAGEGVKATRIADEDLGLSFVFMRGFDLRAYARISRIDSLYGKAYLRREHIVRVAA